MGYVRFCIGDNGLTCAYAHQMQSLVVAIGLRINVSGGCQIASLGQAKTFVQPHLILMCCINVTLYPLAHVMFHFALGG